MQLLSNRFTLGLGGLLLLSGVSSALFDNAFTPGFRGAASTEFSQWENFSEAFAAPNFPDDPASTSDDASITQLTPGAILTSTMNIYNPGATSVFALADTVPGDLTELYLQTRTQGNPPNAMDVTLEYTDPAGLLQVLGYDQQELRSSAGGAEEQLYYWDLTGVADVVNSYTLRFEASAPNMSLDTVQLDTRFGDNIVGIPYCSAEDNSTGVPGQLTAIGSNVAGNNNLVLRATDLPPNQFGYFLNGPLQGFVGGPGSSQGNLCLAGEIGRHLGLLGNTGATGQLDGALDLTQLPRPIGGPVAVMAGETWNFQCWYRDANPAATSNFTQGLEVTFE